MCARGNLKQHYQVLIGDDVLTAVLQTIETLVLLTRTQSLFTFGAPVTLFVGHRMCS